MYSQAIQADRLVFISGQTTNTMTEPSSTNKASIEEQTNAVFEHLKRMSEAAGGSLKNIVKLNIYLTDLSHLDTANQAIEHYFSHPYPCRTTLVVKALENEADISADGIVILPNQFSLEELAVIT
ncbi:RidA family protein [Marinomonas sp. GJ51-6]|uniref:RidA family protein n=1 Tax=Marinomonas sp. GJ51-6 TaxID=2992802 RepID=UPI002934B07C|nr:RidA family protein [Marinomonas sp. GJ51-6]WOD07924.1 RidA family protein [Marinomonas sp. GJ51-6]